MEDYFNKLRFLCSIAANWPYITETTSLYTLNLHISDFKLHFLDTCTLWFVCVLSFIMVPGDFQTWLITEIILKVYYSSSHYCWCYYFHHYQLVVISGYSDFVNFGCGYGICVTITSQVIQINLIGKKFTYFIYTYITL